MRKSKDIQSITSCLISTCRGQWINKDLDINWTVCLPAGWRRSERSGAAPWWRWSTEQPVDGQTSASTCCCTPGGPDHGTDKLSTDPSSVNQNHKEMKSLWLQVRGSFLITCFVCQWKHPDPTRSKPLALWTSQRFSVGWRTYSVPLSPRASSCGREHAGSSSVRTWWTDTAFPARSLTQEWGNDLINNCFSEVPTLMWAWWYFTWSSHRSYEPCK